MGALSVTKTCGDRPATSLSCLQVVCQSLSVEPVCNGAYAPCLSVCSRCRASCLSICPLVLCTLPVCQSDLFFVHLCAGLSVHVSFSLRSVMVFGCFKTAKSLAASPGNPYLRVNFFKHKKMYRRVLRDKKREWKDRMIQRLEQIEERDPKE